MEETSETALWAALRALEEKAAMTGRLADRVDETNERVESLHDQAEGHRRNAEIIRSMILGKNSGP